MSGGVGVGIISEGLLCQKSPGRIRIERIKNAHLGRSVPDERSDKLSTKMAVQTSALKHVVGLYSRLTWTRVIYPPGQPRRKGTFERPFRYDQCGGSCL